MSACWKGVDSGARAGTDRKVERPAPADDVDRETPEKSANSHAFVVAWISTMRRARRCKRGAPAEKAVERSPIRLLGTPSSCERDIDASMKSFDGERPPREGATLENDEARRTC